MSRLDFHHAKYYQHENIHNSSTDKSETKEKYIL